MVGHDAPRALEPLHHTWVKDSLFELLTLDQVRTTLGARFIIRETIAVIDKLQAQLNELQALVKKLEQAQND